MLKVSITLYERHLLLNFLCTDRQAPSNDRRRRIKQVFNALTHSALTTDIEDLFVGNTTRKELTTKTAVISAELSVMESIRDFLKEAMDARNDGKALYDGLDQHYLLKFCDALTATCEKQPDVE